MYRLLLVVLVPKLQNAEHRLGAVPSIPDALERGDVALQRHRALISSIKVLQNLSLLRLSATRTTEE